MTAGEGPILVADIGGSSLKLALEGEPERRTVPTGPDFGPEDAVRAIRETTRGWAYARIAIGCPGPVRGDRVVGEPVNLGPGWIGFDFGTALGCPVRVVNDAVLQALGATVRGDGRTLFLGLGTGLGAALVAGPAILALELAHLPGPEAGTWEDRLGARGLARNGREAWLRDLDRAVDAFSRALLADEVVLGGGNARLVEAPPRGCRLADGSEAFRGGVRLWRERPAVL